MLEEVSRPDSPPPARAWTLALSPVLTMLLVSVSPECRAADGWGGSVDLTSDYFVRGISRSDDHAALQLDVHYVDSSGLVAGAFVSSAQIEPEDQRLHRLGRVAYDRDLLGVAAKLGRQLATRDLDARLEHPPQMLDGRGVGESLVAHDLVEHRRGRGAEACAVEVHDRGVERERAAHCPPVCLIVRLEPRQGDGGSGQRRGDERATGRHPAECASLTGKAASAVSEWRVTTAVQRT